MLATFGFVVVANALWIAFRNAYHQLSSGVVNKSRRIETRLIQSAQIGLALGIAGMSLLLMREQATEVEALLAFAGYGTLSIMNLVNWGTFIMNKADHQIRHEWMN